VTFLSYPFCLHISHSYLCKRSFGLHCISYGKREKCTNFGYMLEAVMLFSRTTHCASHQRVCLSGRRWNCASASGKRRMKGSRNYTTHLLLTIATSNSGILQQPDSPRMFFSVGAGPMQRDQKMFGCFVACLSVHHHAENLFFSGSGYLIFRKSNKSGHIHIQKLRK
jgi:hypothetical protein